jgi:molybdopterin molybdotransferase
MFPKIPFPPVPQMLPVKEAEAIVLNLVQSLDSHRDIESLELLDAIGRILAEPVTSQLQFPHWDNSAMDGYAVRYADVAHCSAENPVVLEVIEEIPAGKAPQQTVGSGQAARIFTGSMMPSGADTIVIQENTQHDENRVSVLSSPQSAGEFVRRQGEFYQPGTPLMPGGIRLQAQDIAVLAAAQCDRVSVYRRPRVAILSSGNELVSIDRPLQPGQIVDSNQYALAAFLMQLGIEPVRLGIVKDDPKAVKNAISKAIAMADLVLSTGGVSVGEYDYIERMLEELGGVIHIRSVAMKPGKPLTVATFYKGQRKTDNVVYFGLPGNPVSALVSCWRFVQPALLKLSGLNRGWQPTFVRAQTLANLKSDGKRESYLWGNLYLRDDRYRFNLAAGSHSSGNLINLAQTNGLAVLPVGETFIAAGDRVLVLQVGKVDS